jgi:hypothetical protein
MNLAKLWSLAAIFHPLETFIGHYINLSGGGYFRSDLGLFFQLPKTELTYPANHY